jgi:hypothetical protein
MSKAEVSKPDAHTTSFKLPGGVVIEARKPTNRIRRLLVEQPEEQIRFMLETIAAACIKRMVVPAGYAEEFPEERVLEFAEDDMQTPWKRFDDLCLMDVQAYTSAFELLNMPTKAMVEAIVDEIKKRKAGKA